VAKDLFPRDLTEETGCGSFYGRATVASIILEGVTSVRLKKKAESSRIKGMG
jgi:hypothetical protein